MFVFVYSLLYILKFESGNGDDIRKLIKTECYVELIRFNLTFEI